jgi:HAE1 family hydrophobic/amphiphilic exporter-1
MSGIAELSIRRPVTAIMFFVSLFVIGLIAAVRLPLESFPEVTFPGIFIELPYTGSTPEEVERTVLRPSEDPVRDGLTPYDDPDWPVIRPAHRAVARD